MFDVRSEREESKSGCVNPMRASRKNRCDVLLNGLIMVDVR
jgi:hypothetical protein